MIIVKNRELLVPLPERYIGTSYDTSSEIRQFRVPRFAQNGTDLSPLTFYVDLLHADGSNAYDTITMGEVGDANYKVVDDNYIILTWYITRNVLQNPGALFVQLRAMDSENTVRWGSFKAVFYVERHLNAPGNYGGSLTLIEQIQQDHNYFKSVIDEVAALPQYVDTAEAWAVGRRNGHDVASSDITYHNNAKYFAENASDFAGNASQYMRKSQAYAEGKVGDQDVDSSNPAYHNNAKYYALEAEAWGVGKRNGENVHSNDPAYHNNALYYKGQAEYFMNKAETEKNFARMWADGTDYEGSPITEEWPQYHNNAKYYSEQADASSNLAGEHKDAAQLAAQQAANSATAADGSATAASVSAGRASAAMLAAQNASNDARAAADTAAQGSADSSGYAQDSEAWAVGQRDGVDVDSSDPTYHNNSKYYKDQSTTWAGFASGSMLNSEAWAVGQKNGTDVPATAEQYHNNSKYYSEQAAAAATRAESAAESLTVDDALSDTSTNAVQNKVVTAKFTDVKSALSAEDTVVNLKHNLINYGYDASGHRAPVSGATDTLVFGYDREGQVITLSGGPLGKNAVVKISGDVGTSLSGGVYPAWLATVLLASDHKYALTVKKLTENAPNIMASVYKQGSSSSMGTDNGWTGDTYQRTIVGDGSLVRVCLYIPSGTSFNSDSYLVLMEDITERPNEEFEYFDYKANEALNLADYGYGSAKTVLQENASTPGSGAAVGVERLGTLVKLNFAGSGTQKRVKVSGDIVRTSGSTTYKSWTGDIQLEEGTRYRFALKKLSGTIATMPNPVVYEPLGANSIATVEKQTDDYFSVMFTAPAVLLSLAIYIGGTNALTDALFDVTLEKIDTSYDIEDYYTDEMTDTIAKVRAEVTEPSLVFPWVTDIHRYTASVQTFPEMIRNMKAFAKNVECDFVLDSGDTIEGNAAQDISLGYAYDCIAAFREIGEPLFYSEGNHDNNPYIQSGALAFTLKQVFSGFFSATKGVSFNINENGTDYYFDFNELGVRFISLNSCNSSLSLTYAYGASTTAWLANALDTNNTVVVATHVSPESAHVWNNNSPTNKGSIKNALDAFVNNGGKLILLTGHSHVDAEFIDPYIEVTDVCQKFEKANIAAEGYTRISGYIDGIRNPDRTAGTYTADAWSVVVYKPISRELSVIRFGAGVDRHIHCDAIAPGTLTSKLSGTVTWSSSDTAVATVADGVVTGVASGKCAVIAKDAEGNIEVWIVEVS